MTAPHLETHIRTRLGSFDLDVAFTARRQGVTALFGASGSGKTSALRVLAGLHRPDTGALRVGDETWIDTERGIFLPPHRRAVGYVFQEASLLPHLSVRENLEFGLRRTPAAERTIAMDDVIGWLGLSSLVERDGRRLSGGERQRVAIGRALLASPRLLLMDEPMSALDETSRDAILPYLERLRDALALPVIYVTHDLDELARLADDIVWMEGGKVRAAGAVSSLLPRIDDTGRRVASLVEGTVAAHDHDDGLSAVDCRFGRMWVRQLDRAVGDVVRIRVAARDVSLALDEEARDSILNVFAGVVTEIRPINAAQVLVDVRCGDDDNGEVLVARITRRSQGLLGIDVGRRLFAKVKSASLEG